ncbi:hypothetical protein [Fluviicola chungangensis]|uniref:DUF3298 domain-containing protein n=1 Tax=Fluviicola chungangensis TaxID=2597671 RepID=A0A556N6U1_9FLAO|nr:hypothetical protein [Fluviicola chungangensis]TSJ47840.1 hypothetical protein FO442_01560 [Fluviicola chungangensis]
MPKLTTFSLKSFSKRGMLLFCIFFVFTSYSLFGQTHSFNGTIGKYPIYLQFTLNGSNAEGYYFYKNKLIDIPLSGTYKGGLITLHLSDEYGTSVEIPETFKFKWPNHVIEGTWTRKEKTTPFKLKPLTPKETGSPKCSNPHLLATDQVIDDLTKVKIGLFKLKETDTLRKINGIKVRYFREITTGIELFRIDSGLVAAKLNDANAYLECMQILEFLESLNCASYSPHGSDFNYSVSNLSVSADFVCFSAFKAFYCGGAHPNEENYGVNYNLNSKEKISFSDFLLPGKEKAFDDCVYRYLAKTNPELFDENERAASSSVYTDCQYHKKELWQITYCDFVLTSEGIKLLPSFPHFAAFCLDPEWAVIPYSELKGLIKPEYYSRLNKLKP